jgi:hypothetical protein
MGDAPPPSSVDRRRYLGRVLDISDDTSPTAGDRDGVRRGHRSPDDGPGLHEYLVILRRHWRLALVTFVVVLGVSVGSLLVIDPVYRAEAEVLVRTEASRQLFPRISGTTPGTFLRSPEAEALYVRSDEFQSPLRAEIGNDAAVQVRNELGSSALVFEAEAGDAALAQRAAQTAAAAYVSARHELDLRETAGLLDLLTSGRDGLQGELQALLQPVVELDEAIAETENPADLSRLLNQRLALQRDLAEEVDPVESELRRLDTQIAALELEQRVLEDQESLARVISPAERPDGRVNGSISQSLAVGVLGGLVLAAAAVAVAQMLRRR